jgi:very-short-patch-repair endonuclease
MKLFDIIIEDYDIDEGTPPKSDNQWIDDLKVKFPNWNYDKASIFRNEEGKKFIKNIYCNIHNNSFPKEGKSLSIDSHRNGTGCRECGLESNRDKRERKPSEWIRELSKIKKFKNKVDFSDIKFHYDQDDQGPLINNFKCIIHNHYFDGAFNNKGIRGYQIIKRDNICPECLKNTVHGKIAKYQEDWIQEYKKNPNNKKFNFDKTKIYTLTNGDSYSFNIECNVKGLDGKKHGLFGIEDLSKKNEGGISSDKLKKGLARCPKCIQDNYQKNFLERAKVTHGKKYLYDKVDYHDPSSMVNGMRKVLIGCKEHGYFFQNPTNHVNGQGCPICRESKGEKYVRSLLTSKFGGKYKIISQKMFIEIGQFEFDFYIPELKVLIEYDGEGHFWPVFGSSESSRNSSYNRQFDFDNQKNNFIKTKSKNTEGIRLIRIPYNMEYNEIDAPLLQSIKNTPPNQITYIGEYPRRHNRKEVKSKFQVNESKLSLIKTLYTI